MDFPGGANTNIHRIDGFSNIYWRIYTEDAGITNNPQDGPANGYTILKHLSRLKELEARLRILNCLASCPRRLGLWIFSPTPDFKSLHPLYVRESDTEPNHKIVVGTTTLKVSASGSVSSPDLVKGLSSDNQNQQGSQPAGQPRTNQGQPSPRRQDGYNSSAAIHASFISAVTGAISLQLIRRHAALPLGSRTLFTAVAAPGYESPFINNDSIFSNSCLTTVNIQLTMGGTITVSTQTISQTGIMRLWSPRDDVADLLRMQPGIDLWLCPNGTIARLVTNIESPSAPSPGYPAASNMAAKRTQWKIDVVQWLRNFGLQVDSIEDEPWVEVEIWEPFFARLAGETWRKSDDNQSTLPLKRMLWPARYCFKRATSPHNSFAAQVSLLDEPLDFAEQWSQMASSLQEDHTAHTIQNTSAPQDIQPKGQDIPSPIKTDSLDNIESLSRIAQYPDLQITNLVYPTPPDGAAAIGLNNPNPSETFVGESDPRLPHETQGGPTKDAPGSASPFQDNGFGVGTGRYDASDEEDLFGEMNDPDFGSKGITDADFSFFDEPDFEGMDCDPPQQDVGETVEPSPPPDIQADAMSVHEDQASVQQPIITAQPEPREMTASPMSDGVTHDVDESMAREGSVHSPTDGSKQTISPPLSPVEVKRILFLEPEAEASGPSKNNRGQGHYNPVTFRKRLGDWDQKYGATGKFWFSTGGPSDTRLTSAIPTIGIPRRERISDKASGSLHSNKIDQSLIRPESFQRSPSVTSDSSDDSIETPSEHASTAAAIPSTSTLKRKRAPSDSEIVSVAFPEKTMPTVPGTETSPADTARNSTFLGNFLANFSDWTLTGYFSTSPPQQLPVLARREDQLEIAQLLVDQITQSSLKHPLDGTIGLFDIESQFLSLHTLDDTSTLGEVSRMDFKRYTSLQDELTSNQQLRPPQHPPPPRDIPKSFITKLSAPHLRVRRGAEYLEALPPAVAFWETFGLQPAHGPKNISAYCLHPPAASKAADVFLNRFGLLYQSCSLGNHTRGENSVAFEDGLKPWGSGASSYESMMRALKKTCEELGSELSRSPATGDNCVVYIINPFTHASALADICSAFWHLFQQFVADCKRRQVRHVDELVLQIIPLEFVMLSDSLAMPPQTDYMNLALEVYSRCRPQDNDMSPLLCAPPMLLAETVPRAINFRLTPERSSPLQEGRSLHIACSKSLDQRWVSVAWSDTTGSIQRTMSYCLRYRQSTGARPMSEVRNEIWATTKHIMGRFKARWRVQLVVTDPMEPDEVEAWPSLADQHNKSRPGSLELTILAVNTIPDLILEPPIPPLSMAMLNILSSSTPVSTPNANTSVASPEQYATAATPNSAGPTYSAPTPTEMSLETDPEAVITDITDDSWLAILSHRLNSSPHLTESRPALSSGYLLRRKGATDNDGVFALCVNLIYSPRPPASHDHVLKDTLSMYRDLGCLARAKGLRSVQNNTLPWHIATALRGQELLSYVF
ncbi:Mediator complex subunit Med13 [Penicillium sp. DV-2018c]|nr:Mediator complex subunit Med13 [Penicillium sp. DV-2018c]